jgi:WD40 repeat protein
MYIFRGFVVNRAFLRAVVLLNLSTVPLSAADLSQIDRKITKEPAYKSKRKYCLLVFGPEAKTRVWLVQDGDIMYVDCNGNGDLTEAGEKFTADLRDGIDEGEYTFTVGDIVDGTRLHKALSVGVSKIDLFLAEQFALAKVLPAKDPKARGYCISIDMEMPGRRGTGVGSRVRQHLFFGDAQGILQFADQPQDAPIIHFGGPLQATLFRPQRLTIGRERDVVLGVGTPGLGTGTTAFIDYKGVIPEEAHPTLEVIYPPKQPGEPPVRERYEPKRRWRYCQLEGPVRTPETAGAGTSQVTVAFDAWKAGHVAPSRHKVSVRESFFKIEPVSNRIRGELIHPNRIGRLRNYRFSPDGKRLIAGDDPGGVVVVWDVATGKELTRIETGYGDRSLADYFFLTPDWQTLFASRGKHKSEPVEQGGKRLFRWEVDGEVREFDMATGQLRRRYKHEPPREIFRVQPSPDGTRFVTLEWLPGTYERIPRQDTSLWNRQTGQYRPLPDGLEFRCFSRDGQTLGAASVNENGYTALKLLDVATGREKLSIPIKDENVLADFAFSPDNRQMVGGYTIFERANEWDKWQRWLKWWDPVTGKELGSFAGDKNEGLSYSFSPDGQTLAVISRKGQKFKLLLFRGAERQPAKTLLVEQIRKSEPLIVHAPVFSPNGKWLALLTHVMPLGIWHFDDPQHVPDDPQDVPQSRVLLIDVAAGAIRETLIAPQGFAGSPCFSPDGRTLATAGDGRVLLWDMATLLGPTEGARKP